MNKTALTADAQVIDQMFPPLRQGKIVWQCFNVAAVSPNKSYFFSPDPQVKRNIITGIDIGYYNTNVNNYPQTIFVDGINYNVIVAADLAKVLLTFYNHKDEMTLRRSPISCFRTDLTAELKIYNLRINLDASFLEFVQTPLVTTLPMIIPFRFYWD